MFYKETFKRTQLEDNSILIVLKNNTKKYIDEIRNVGGGVILILWT